MPVLSALEERLVAVVAGALASRPGLAVAGAGTAPDTLAAGTGRLVVGIGDAVPDGVHGFAREDPPPGGGPPAIIRVLSLRITVTIAFRRRAATDDDDGHRAARRALLDDATLVLHALDAIPVRTGAALRPADPAPGFVASRVDLASFTVAALPTGDEQNGVATYVAQALVWPPEPGEATGLIETVDVDLGTAP
ncbi:hypothetical protein [Frankia gtarii]|uniref:hypothetical protein n=1 Tax=Frankia gtarii TaxID=2950102 RepID=UPI0021C1CB70|nr:hypothetical protein [Frankia gtarii]